MVEEEHMGNRRGRKENEDDEKKMTRTVEPQSNGKQRQWLNKIRRHRKDKTMV